MEHHRLAALIFSLFACAPAFSIPVIDQSHEGIRDRGYLLGNPPGREDITQSLAQRFTPGLQGRLTGFSLDMSLYQGSDRVNVYLRDDIDGRNLARFRVRSPVEGWVDFKLKGRQIRSTPGNDMFLVVESRVGSYGDLFASSTGDYAGGEMWGKSVFTGFQWESFPTDPDFHFKTYVDAVRPPVPEPSSMILALGGISFLAGVQYKRKSRKSS